MIAQLAAAGTGSLSPPLVAMLAIAVLAYSRRARKLARAGRPVPRARQLCFYAGGLILLGEPLTPIAAGADGSFVSHMVEHLLIGDLAALLMVLGVTGPLIAPLLRLDLIGRLRVLAHPAVALPLWAVDLVAWHVPVMMEAAIGNDYVHVLQHMLFFGLGFNMWMPLFGPLPTPAWFGNVAKLGYIVAMRFVGLLLGNFFVFSDRAYYPSYVGADNMWGMDAPADQSTAGAVMMIEGMVLFFVLLAWLFFKAAREGEESRRTIDLAAAHGIELSGERSARAAAAGASGRLRERILSADAAADSADNGGPPRGGGRRRPHTRE